MPISRWSFKQVERLYALPFLELVFKAQSIHRKHFKNNEMELCSLLSVKTGSCPEDCAYCPQSGHYQTEVQREKLMSVEEVTKRANAAKANGATRFCMGAAWRSPPKKGLPQILEMIKAVKAIGLETCATLGMLDEESVQQLKVAGLDFYNHNLDTSPEYYAKIIMTRTYQDRLDTLKKVSSAGINVCCGGIVGMGESRDDRIGLLLQLANLPIPPKSVPINRLIPFKGTPLEKAPPIDDIEFIRTIALARILMEKSMIRLSAGRMSMSESTQILCFMAGANSIFLGEKLLTAQNSVQEKDLSLLKKLGMNLSA